MSNHYEILGVAITATPEEIKAAYKRMSRVHHPDREGGDSSRMSEINVAYETLSDPERRKNYDLTGQDRMTNVEQAAQDLVIGKIMQWISNEFARGDIMDSVRSEIENELSAVRANKKKGERILAKLQSSLTKIKFKGDGIDRVRGAIEAQISHITGQLAKVDIEIQRAILAVEFSYKYEYEIEESKAPFLHNNIFNGARL